MYPNLYYALKDLLGLEIEKLQFVNSFGFFVAIAFVVSAYFLSKELMRKESEGLLVATEIKVIMGAPASVGELMINFILGFVFGYKFIGLFLASAPEASDPQSFIFSLNGNWLAGFVVAFIFAGVKWWEKNKTKLNKPETRIIRIWPHDRVGDIIIIAAIFGFLGAKIFHNLENWNEFWSDPIAALLSFSGLTFYGGLICATLAIFIFSRKHKIVFRQLCDAAAPALILGYAIGRVGCMVSGDGDWGVLNSAYVLDQQGQVVPASDTAFRSHLKNNTSFYSREYPGKSIDEIPHHYVKAPLGLPAWTVAYTFPHNVISYGVPIPECTEGLYCRQLPGPVFPTSFYEMIMGVILFFVLWSIRKKIKIPGQMFSIYLVLNGLERFLIEKIRVNTTYTIGGFHPTQAELISSSMIIGGVLLFYVLKRRNDPKVKVN